MIRLLNSKNPAKFFFLTGLFLFAILFNLQISLAQTGTGGTKSLFLGAGARALSLGNAYVALSNDPAAVFYNPAGLDYIEKKSASFYYTSLIASSQYSFVGLVYPTTSIGSFGFGWIRIGTGDIVERDENAIQGSTFGYNHNQFIFSYGKQLKSSISLGINLKLEKLSFSLQNLSDSGVGIDVAVLYRPVFDNPLLNDMSVGFNFQNLINPKTRLIDASEASPRNLKIGLAKPIRFGEERNAFTLLFDFNKSGGASPMYHVGAEYSFNNQAMLRFGMNDGLIAFGAGAAYKNYHFDYSFGKMFDGAGFSANHRFSITIEIGKSKTELIRIAREKEQADFLVKHENEMWFTRETEFNNNMEDGREKFNKRDYLGAFVDFSSAHEAANAMVETALRLRGENMHDPEANMRVETANSSVHEAQTMLELANTKYDSTRIEEIRQITKETIDTTRVQELRDFVLEHREKGNAFYKNKSFSRALSEWQLALERITQGNNGNLPNWLEQIKSQLENNIKSAENKLQGNIKEAINRANVLQRRGQFVQALEELNNVRGFATTESERVELNRKINSIQSQLNFQQHFDEGIRRYANKDWKNALDAFNRALKIKSRHPQALKYRKDAEDRYKAINQEMPPNLRIKFLRGVELYRKGQYQEALEIWEQANEAQPYNKRIFDYIDLARERLKEKNRK